MSKIEENHNYQEGRWEGKQMSSYIAKTVYKSIDEAILQKTILVEKFEKDFGYTRDMTDHVDVNYFFNVGILDGLKAVKDENNKNV